MRLYVAGPMTGRPGHNFRAFAEATEALRSRGVEVVSPHELTLNEYATLEAAMEVPWEAHMKRDIAALMTCDGIATLDGWETSRGAQLETTTALALGMRVMPLHWWISPAMVVLGAPEETAVTTQEPAMTSWTPQPSTGAVKADTGKARVDLIPPGPLVGIAEVFGFGARKYSDRNWEKGFKWGRIYGAALRHLFAWWSGEDLDPESGFHHLYHAGCDVLMLAEFVDKQTGEDDRP